MVLLLAVAVACGNDAGSGGTDRVEISLGEFNGSGQSGTATPTASGGATNVVPSLGEGTMKSGKAHVHNGQCGPDLKGGGPWPDRLHRWGLNHDAGRSFFGKPVDGRLHG